MSRLTGHDARRIYAESPIVLLPLGSHEDQGPHAPMGDFLLAERIAEIGAERAQAAGVPTYVAPVLPYGADDYFRSMVGGIVLEPSTLVAVLHDVIGTLADNGLTRIVIVNGHRGNAAPIEEVSRDMQRRRGLSVPCLHIWELAYKTLEDVVGAERARQRAGHGADPLASTAMHLFPDLVKEEHMPIQRVTKADPALGLDVVRLGVLDMNGANVALPSDYADIFHDGVGQGAPRLADAETGRALTDRLAGAVAELAQLVATRLPRHSSSGSTPTGPVEVLDDVARRLDEARRSGTPCEPVRNQIGAADLDTAYAVQGRLTLTRLAEGARIVGRKIGLTSRAVQAQLGVDRPDFGVLFDDMQVEDGASVSVRRLLQPKIEAEIAFRLTADLAEGPLDRHQIRAAVGTAHAALEIVDSRIRDWDITFGDTVADNASSGLFVLAPEGQTLEQVEPVEVEMRLTRNGEEVSTGNGAACLNDPLEALVWLARTLVEMGDPLRAGDIVLSGALGPMVTVGASDRFEAEISGLGRVSVTFTDDAPNGVSVPQRNPAMENGVSP